MNEPPDEISGEVSLSPFEVQSATWISHYKSSVSGAAAGCVSAFITCPLDVIKTKMQHQQHSRFADIMRSTLAKDGVRGFYRGLSPTLLGYLPSWSIYFTVYSNVKTAENSTLNHLSSAVLAGITSTIVTNPVWVIRTRFMIHSSQFSYSSVGNAFSRIYHEEGWKTFYKGLGPSLFGIMHVALQFPLYERLKASLVRPDQSHFDTTMGILLSSMASKMLASITTYPHEVIRTRLQAQNYASGKVKYAGVFDAIRTMMREEGINGFYRGLGVNLVRTVPASAATILTYELLMMAL